MLDITVNTLVRDGDEFLELCLTTILPYVKRVIITVDTRSKDKTEEIVEKLQKAWPNKVVVYSLDVENPFVDLIGARNHQLRQVTTKFGWIVDADEFHPFVSQMNLAEADSYGFLAWTPWTPTLAHKATSKNPIGRIFKMKPTLEWRGPFGKEVLFDGDNKVFSNMELLPMRYIHLTHVKKDVWRKEMKQQRVADGRSLSRLPEEIINIIHEKMPNLQGRDVQERLGHGG